MRIKSASYALLLFLAGALTSSIFEWLHPITAIEVKNASSKVIKYLDIEYRNMGDHRGRIAENVRPGHTVTFKWATESEASYHLLVTFDDGSQIAGGAGYTSRGDTVREVIESTRVLSALPVKFMFGLPNAEARDTTRK